MWLPPQPRTRLLRACCGALALSLLYSTPVAAATPDASADELPVAQGAETVVTANRMAESVSDSLTATRVIGPRELAASGALSLGEVLRQFGGVEVAAAGGLGQTTSLYLRGANTDQTLVLVDGMRLQSASAGTTALENIPVSQIARIEVVPGPASGLYGSDAIGGVIQIFTKGGGQAGAAGSAGSEVALGLGSYQTGRIQAGTQGRADSLEYSVSAGYLGSESFSATNPGVAFGLYNPDRDPYRNRNASARLAWDWASDHVLAVRLFQSAAATHFDNGPGSDDVAWQTLSQFAVTSDDRITPDWRSAFQAGASRDSYHALAFGALGTVQRQIGWQNTFTLPGAGTLIAGLDDLEEHVDGDTVFSQTARDTRAEFLGYAGDAGPLGLRANLRHAQSTAFGSVNTGSLAAGWRLDPALKLRASYGTGFHAPTFNDLYSSYPPYYYSNPALQPERSRNLEFGADLSLSGQHLGLSVFDNRIHDLIQIADDPAQPGAQTVLNVDSARIRGLELAWDGSWRDLRWDLRATWQDPLDDATGLRLTRRASSFASGRVSCPLAGIEWSLEGQAVGSRYDSATQDPATRLGGYGLLNLVAVRRLSAEWRAELRWNNLADHRYVLVQGYNVPSSSVFATLVWSSQ